MLEAEALVAAKPLPKTEYLGELSFAEAVSIIADAAPDAILGLDMTAKQLETTGDTSMFLNKLAVCVEQNTTGNIAVFNKDSRFYRIRVTEKANP